MHPAIEKRAEKMKTKGLEPGGFYNDYQKTNGRILEAPTEFGVFKVYLDLYPDPVDEAWFEADAEHAWRFRSSPGQ